MHHFAKIFMFFEILVKKFEMYEKYPRVSLKCAQPFPFSGILIYHKLDKCISLSRIQYLYLSFLSRAISNSATSGLGNNHFSPENLDTSRWVPGVKLLVLFWLPVRKKSFCGRLLYFFGTKNWLIFIVMVI